MNNGNDKEDQTTSPSDESVSLNLGNAKMADEIGTIFVNHDYRIKRFISTITDLINVNSFNIEHEFEEFAQQFTYSGMKDDVNYVLENQERINKEIPARGGHWYMMEIHPYLTEEQVEGVVITFANITELKETQEKLTEKIEKIKKLQRQIIKNDVSERWRIGQFLHDDLGQSLVSAQMLLSNMKNKLASGEEGLEEDIDQLIDFLGQSMDDVRDLSHEIVPVDIQEKGITHAFNNFARQVEKVNNIQCKLEYDSTVDNIENIEIATHLYRIAQEAAKNAAIHGEAENIKISLQSDDQYVYLDIADDGTGFSDDTKKRTGMGINIMRHRMELIGGTFEIKDTSDLGEEGATISCKVPLEKIET